MIDFEVLKECGTTNERLREFFTADSPHHNTVRALQKKDPAKLAAIELDVKRRKEYEERLESWLNESIVFSLQNHHIYSAVDYAWDAAPINKLHLPLMLYAQGRIDVKSAASSLKDLPDGQKFMKKNERGDVIAIDLPKFLEVKVNLIRSVITRRLAAQTNKYNNLFPFFKYEGRSKSQVAKLRSEATSERIDIMADQFDYRRGQEQEGRDMMLYAHCVAFPRCAWECEKQWKKRPIAPEMAVPGQSMMEVEVVKEGVAFVNPHPSRVIWDNSYALSSLNTDTGCEWVGFWDVTRYRDIVDNPVYFNREKVTWGPNATVWFTAYATYFNEHWDKIKPPSWPNDMTGMNDRKSNVGVYTSDQRDSATFFTHMYVKETPKTWGWGTYPWPVWVHLIVAGDHTVIGAEIMPSAPAAVGSFNESDSRLVNISLAHELMPYQDQLSNLYTQFLETLQQDLFAVAVLNKDIFPEDEDGRKAKADFKSAMASNNFSSAMQTLFVSFGETQRMLGANALSADNIYKIIRSGPNEKLTDILKAITTTINLAERMVWLSPHEQGQPAGHEITAHETRALGATTDDMRNFFSDAMDAMRSAKKKICYESWMALGSDKVKLSVINRYPMSVIKKAGLEVVDEDGDGDFEGASAEERPGNNRYVRLMGSKKQLEHDYIFTTRDGGERTADTKSATVLVELLGRLATMAPEIQKAILGGIGREKLYEIFNEIFRMADASIDLKLELKPGDDDSLLLEDDEQVMGMLQKMGEQLNMAVQDIAMLKQAVGATVTPQLMAPAGEKAVA